MNRRQLLAKIAGGLAAAGVTGAKLQAIEAEPPPLLLVVKLDRPSKPETRQMVRECLERLFHGKKPCPIVVVDGMSIEAVRDPAMESTS